MSSPMCGRRDDWFIPTTELQAHSGGFGANQMALRPGNSDRTTGGNGRRRRGESAIATCASARHARRGRTTRCGQRPVTRDAGTCGGGLSLGTGGQYRRRHGTGLAGKRLGTISTMRVRAVSNCVQMGPSSPGAGWTKGAGSNGCRLSATADALGCGRADVQVMVGDTAATRFQAPPARGAVPMSSGARRVMQPALHRRTARMRRATPAFPARFRMSFRVE